MPDLQVVDPFTGATSAWFVYLVALADGTAFKAGFSSNPLQRILSFNPRYFERFDLPQSRLLRAADSNVARDIKSELKQILSPHRVNAPEWVSPDAGGHTEWFSMERFADAESRILDHAVRNGIQIMEMYEYLADELTRASAQFELWARSQAVEIDKAWDAAFGGWPAPIALARSLRNWIDAYRHFSIEVYTDDSSVRDFVVAAAYRRE